MSYFWKKLIWENFFNILNFLFFISIKKLKKVTYAKEEMLFWFSRRNYVLTQQKALRWHIKAPQINKATCVHVCVTGE